jgi:hypothetical protein
MTILFLFLTLFPSLEQNSIASTEALVKAMKEQYAGSWYRSVTFTQKTVTFQKDGSRKEALWYEYMKIPSQLRIEFAPVDEGNGILFKHDSLFVFEKGMRKSARPVIHPLLLLGFDVYTLSTEETIRKLRKLGYDLSLFHENAWQGRPAYVVGAAKGDERSKQFWIDKERLVFVRSLEHSPRDSTTISEVQFNDYRRLEGGWIGAEVLFLQNGQRTMEEYYSDIKANIEIPDEVFDRRQWKGVID